MEANLENNDISAVREDRFSKKECADVRITILDEENNDEEKDNRDRDDRE